MILTRKLLYGEKMDSLFDSLSLKSQTLSEAEKERERKIVSMQRDSHEEHKRFNTSSDTIVKNFKVQSNKTLQELILQQQKDFNKMLAKRETVAFSAHRSNSQTLSSREKVIFDGVWTYVGNGYEPSTGVFTAPHPGLYHFTAVLMSSDKKDLSLYLTLNELRMTRSYLHGDGYKTGTFDVVFNLHKGDTVYIQSDRSQTIFSTSDKYVTFTGYRIT
ncbi:C1QL [Mytilus edulis]|uniref:C1QL n=1 Tax=Mytilus edulis TaxID=6550 RepID=A0A8S3QAQ2_MYTED|nr:C1QL [Mytilus edulis]